MYEVNWGQPLVITVPAEGDTRKISTIEQARYLLSRKWPVDDPARSAAITAIGKVMDCMGSVDDARLAFVGAARSAGLTFSHVQFA